VTADYSPPRAGVCSGAVLIGLAVVASVLSGAQVGRACDVCAIYTATDMRESRLGAFAGVAEQFTSYNTLQDNGREVANPAGERLNSSITQFIVGYTFKPWLGVQLNLPVIGREFRRREAGGVVNGDETGIGDLSVMANWVPFSTVTENSVVRWSILGGLKLPSGNSRRLQEELPAPQPDDGAPDPFKGRPQPRLVKYHLTGANGVQSGVHGHDLALGSGSTDVVLGTQLFASWKRAFLTGGIQCVVRTEGDFGYQFNNDLTWSGGPGVFALLAHSYTLGLQATISGESKGKDSLNGVPADDTARTGVYIGPQAVFTWGTSLAADVGVDVSVIQNNAALQIVPDFRLRGGVTWRF
jgi:hypothetical protein